MFGIFIYVKMLLIFIQITPIIASETMPPDILDSPLVLSVKTISTSFKSSITFLNSAIVFAPAFAGPRSEINKYPK